MKRIFFTLIIACSMALVAVPLEHSLSAQEVANQSIVQSTALASSSSISNDSSLENLKGLQTKRRDRHQEKKGDDPDPKGAGEGTQGPPGPKGDPGIPGPGGVAGVSNAYGSFFTEEITTVNEDSPILFTSRAFSTSNVTLLADGVIQLTQTGDYLVVFGASTTGPNSRIVLVLNRTAVPGTNVTLPASLPNQLTTVSTIVHVTSVPATLQVFNNTSSSITLSSVSGLDITGFITVEKVHNLPTPVEGCIK
jgi:hypothetical protein